MIGNKTELYDLSKSFSKTTDLEGKDPTIIAKIMSEAHTDSAWFKVKA